MTVAVMILAAGQGTRMLSKKQKILHEVGGKPMVSHAFAAAQSVASLPPVLIVGPGEDGVRSLFGEQAEYVVQPEQLGTGHAAMMGKGVLNGRSSQVIVTYGGMPRLRSETMACLAQKQVETGAAVVMLSVMGASTSSFGRVVRGDEGHGSVLEIVEVAEAKQRANTAEILAIRELNAGVYCFDAQFLWDNIDHLPLRRARSGHEYYLTDMIGLAVAQNRLVEAIAVSDPDECLGAGTRSELVDVEKAFRRRANGRFLAQGVTLIDPATTYIDQDVEIGQDTIIWPNSYVQGQTIIGADCVIGPNTIVRDARVGDGCVIEQAVVEGVTVAAATRVAPFSYRKL
ncbi:MAG: NTP transferase domain-containing protein [Anaerolineales bacterium]|nr:NTP transferase domain-containing protein [Anaerolineales bacterium]